MNDRLAPGSLSIQRSEQDGTLILALRGELDLGSTPMLETELSDGLSDGARRITIDLGQLEFMDSRGLHALLRAQHAAETNQMSFSLRPGARQVQRLFELTGLAGHFAFEE